VAHWSCDTGCFSASLVIDAPHRAACFREMAVRRASDIGYKPTIARSIATSGLSFRASSNLLVAEGCFDGETR